MKNNLPVTKEELVAEVAKLATKDELKAEVAKLATKDELKAGLALLEAKMVTKEEAKKFATKEDIYKSEKTVRALARLDHEALKKEIYDKIDLLPTKEEFFSKMDELMGELQAMREEQTLSAYRLSNHEDRIGVLEQKAGVASI